jgi:hypothetical protein
MRADAVLVKPDVPLVPTDESILLEAQNPKSPMVASTYTEHGGLRDLYVFAYTRGDNPEVISFSPTTLGVAGPAYVYDVYADTGRLISQGEASSATVSSGSYFIAAPLGPSGIAFLGDAGAFVSLGKKRISQLVDDGTLRASVEFVAGEQALTLHGFAASAPQVTVSGGFADEVAYDAASQRFRVVVHPDAAPSTVNLALSLA